MTIISSKFKNLINQKLNKNKKIYLFFKGRVAFYSLLKSINIQKNDEVIIPAFTCVVVPNAILYLNAKPIYIDIKPF